MEKKYVKYKNTLSKKNKIGRLLWNATYVIFFRPFSLPFFNVYRIWILKAFGAKIGINCKISSKFKVWAPWNLEMGDLVAIGFDAFIYNPSKIILGNKITISQRSHLCSASHDIYQASNPLISQEIYIKDQAWVATDAFVGMGVTIGEGAVVGARACVYKDVSPWTVVGGNPAKFIKKRIINE